MLRKIIRLVCFPVIVLPFLSGKILPAVALSLTHKEQLSSQVVSNSVRDTSLLISGRYDQDRDDDRECHHQYQEVYRNIERNRQDLEEADSERDRSTYERKLDRDFRRLAELRENDPDCDYQVNNREYRDHEGNIREHREYHEYHDYGDESPTSQLRPRPIPQYPPE